MRKTLVTLVIFLVSLSGFSQSAPMDVALSAICPHAPSMQRYDGNGKSIAGAKFTYKYDENIVAISKWMNSYPEELAKYKTAVEDILSNSDVTALNDLDAILFDAYAVQYKLIKAIANW